MAAEDLVFIAHSLFPELSRVTVENMVSFNNKVWCPLVVSVIIVILLSGCDHYSR